MKSVYDTCTKDKVKVSYSLYAMLIELGLNPSNKGTIYLKEVIEYIILNNLYDYTYNETNYLAMKLVPLLERKILYLSYIENARLNDICRRLKLQKREVITLRNKAITHFKNNLATLNNITLIKKGGI